MKPVQLITISIVFILAIGCEKKGDTPNVNNPPSEDTYDLNNLGVPKFVKQDYTILDSVKMISKFRSGVGHDYSDDFETCRSMKHYYPISKGTQVICPISGTVNFVLQEWAGTKIQINSDFHSAFYFELFHVELDSVLEVGDHLTAGQIIGVHSSNQTMSDIAVFVRVPGIDSAATKFISYFDLMTDSLFGLYQQRGVAHRDSLIISKQARDADPLTCIGQWGSGIGNLPNWTHLN